MNLDELKEMQEEKNKNNQEVPKTLKELKKLLKNIGEEWRNDHITTNEKTGKVKIPPVSPRSVADIVKKHCHFILISEDNPELAPLAVYDLDNGIYRKGERFINQLYLSVERTLTAAHCKNITHYLTVECEEKEPTKDKNLIIVNNGVYNKNTSTLEPFSHKYVFVNKVATNYVKYAKEPKFDDWNFSEWIEELSDGNASKKKLLWQILAIALNSNYISEVAIFFLSEEGRTGKSTFQDLLISLVGRQNSTSLKIREFEKDFKLASAYGSSLVVGDDNNSKDFNETSENFKSVITGETVLLNPKGKEPFTTRLTPFVVQSMNGMARFKDVSDGLLRRLRIVRFNHSYKGDKNNRRIKEEYIHDKRLLEFILYKAIQLDFEEVEDTAESQEVIGEIRRDNDAVYLFYEEVFPELQSERLPMKFLFQLFRAWSDSDNNPTKMKQNTFTKEMRVIAERDDWIYSRNNLAPLNFFVHVDEEYHDRTDKQFKYGVKIDRDKKQPLIWKDGR